MSLKETDKVLEQKKIERELKKQEEAEALEKIEALRNIDVSKMNPWKRFSLLKLELRYILLKKSEAGYNARYFYVSLSAMQKVIVELENKYDLTSSYTEEFNEKTGKHEAVRKLFDTREISIDNCLLATKIDITNLKETTDPYELKTAIIQMAKDEKLPKDILSTLWLGYLDAKEIGGISTYMQRYTYNQLYDFQETTEDTIEIKASQKERVLEAKKTIEEKESKKTNKKVEEKTETGTEFENQEEEKQLQKQPERKKTQEEIRLSDKTIELRKAIKTDFTKEQVMPEVKKTGKSMNEMSEEELLELINILTKKQIENKGE